MLFFKNLVPDIKCNCRDRYIGQLFAIFLGHLDDALSEIVAEGHEYPTPESSAYECDRDKWSKAHRKYTSRDRDQVAYYRDESSYECVYLIISDEEILCSLIFLWCDEDIFAIFREKWFAKPLTEYEIIE